MNTKKLITIIVENCNKMIEVQLILNQALATHFIYFNNTNNTLIDEGIDGQPYEIKVAEFYKKYKYAKWQLNQIV